MMEFSNIALTVDKWEILQLDNPTKVKERLESDSRCVTHSNLCLCVSQKALSPNEYRSLGYTAQWRSSLSFLSSGARNNTKLLFWAQELDINELLGSSAKDSRCHVLLGQTEGNPPCPSAHRGFSLCQVTWRERVLGRARGVVPWCQDTLWGQPCPNHNVTWPWGPKTLSTAGLLALSQLPSQQQGLLQLLLLLLSLLWSCKPRIHPEIKMT